MGPRGKVVVVEDEWIVGRDIQFVLEGAGFEVPGVASAAPEAMALIERSRPDLVLMDVVLGGPVDGIELVRRLAGDASPAVVYLTAYADDATLERARQTVPLGYIVKPFDHKQLLSTVIMALGRRRLEQEQRGESLSLYREALQRIAAVLGEVDMRASASPKRDLLTALSQREQEVVRLLLANGRVPTIARALYLSPHTVRNHLKSVFRKLGVSSQTELLELLRAH